MLFLSAFASSFRAAPDSNKVNLPSWLFWVLILVVVALIAGLLIRDKALRNKIAAGLNKLKKRWIRARLRGKIKKGQRTLSEALPRLGQAAWKAGHRPEAAAEAFRELDALHETIRTKNSEIEKIELEAAGTKQVQADFLQSQKARIDKQVEAARPHREELSGRQARLKEVELALGDAEKTVTGSADRAAPLRTEKASIMEAAAKIQAVIDGYDKAIEGLSKELSEKLRASEALVAEMNKKKSGLKAEIDATENKKLPHWVALGKTLNEKRVDDPALAPLYAEIDGIDKTIRENEARHKDLSG
jgi:chromosome segregation ATPase